MEYNESTGYLLSDGNLIIKALPTLKLFNDRGMFPTFPLDGDCYTYSKKFGDQKTGPQLEKLIVDCLNADLDHYKLTQWQNENAILLHNGQRFKFINQALLDLLEFTGVIYSAGGTVSPFIFTENELSVDDIFAIMAPFRLDFTRPDVFKFPNIGELIE